MLSWYYIGEYCHEAFINLQAANIIDESDLGNQIVACKSIQEAYAMLIAEAPRWKVKLMSEGFLKGKEEGKEEGIAMGKTNGVSIDMKKLLLMC